MKDKIERKELKMPHTFIILFVFIVAMSLLSYIVPAGEYERIQMDGRDVVNPDSFTILEKTPVTLMGLLSAVPKGFVESGDIIILTLCVGAAVAVLQAIGVIPVAIEKLANKFSNKSILIIPLLMFIFSLSDAFIGVNEMTLVYVPIILPLMIRLGFDSMTACAIALCGSAAGFSAALTNPFTIAIGQKISGLPLYSGWQFRVITYAVTLLIGVIYTIKYAKKIQNDITKSYVYEEDVEKRELYGNKTDGKQLEFTTKQKYAGISAIILLIVTLVGVIAFKWDMFEMSGMFITIGVVSGFIGGFSGNEVCDNLLKGCGDMLMGGIIIGIARGISVVMRQANISDTIVHFFANMLGNIPGIFVAIGILFVVTIMNFLIPSGSGKAVILFPILAPLADVVGVTRQTAVLAYQFGDGFSNIIYPSSGYFMACIANAGVPWKKWVKFFLPLLIVWTIEAAIFLIIAQTIGFGPF